MGKKRQATLATGATTLHVIIDKQSEVTATGTFGSVVLSDFTGGIVEETFTADGGKASVMTEMLFVLTGTGPVVVSVTPLQEGTIQRFDHTA